MLTPNLQQQLQGLFNHCQAWLKQFETLTPPHQQQRAAEQVLTQRLLQTLPKALNLPERTAAPMEQQRHQMQGLLEQFRQNCSRLLAKSTF
jgi:hypothetical protein